MMWRVHRLNEVNGEFVLLCTKAFSQVWEIGQAPCSSVHCIGDVSQVTLSWDRKISPVSPLLQWLSQFN